MKKGFQNSYRPDLYFRLNLEKVRQTNIIEYNAEEMQRCTLAWKNGRFVQFEFYQKFYFSVF